MDNSRYEVRERGLKDKEDIKKIRKKIRASLNRKDRGILPGIKNNEKDKELPEKENDSGESYSGDSKIFDHSEFNRRFEEKELLAKK